MSLPLYRILSLLKTWYASAAGTARVTTEYLGTQVIMSMITDSGDEYEYWQSTQYLEYRFGLSMSIACQG